MVERVDGRLASGRKDGRRGVVIEIDTTAPPSEYPPRVTPIRAGAIPSGPPTRARRGCVRTPRTLAVENVLDRDRTEEHVDVIAQFLPQIMCQAAAAVFGATQWRARRTPRRTKVLVDGEYDIRDAGVPRPTLEQ